MSEGWWNTGRAKVASVMKTSQGIGSKGGQVGSGRRLKSPDTTMRWPLNASTACAEPRMWPAGASSTSTSPIRTLSPYFSGCWLVSGMSSKRVRMIASVSGVASAARCPGRA